MTFHLPKLSKLIGPAILALAAIMAVATEGRAVCCYYSGYYIGEGYYLNIGNPKVHPCAPLYSALNAPLRPYFMPRQPAWGGQDFCYQVAPPVDCNACENNPARTDCPAGPPYRAELAEIFAPTSFEHLGEVPNDSLLQGGSGPTSSAGR